MPIIVGDLKLFAVKELSETLGIQELTIRTLLRNGKLKGRKIARRWMVTEDSLREYFNQSEVKPDKVLYVHKDSITDIENK